ncbi:hypothetical protein [Amycolatopsis sp. FDAARGOS 1241]|uniref:hypothetical protein n=1 Tax=Amycolatopsis sp. FDAARGOS 1241 TaxID=2778070 RepID=UPI00194FC419|nr:hypothetical protein [Amycolatopsis sp. FDAARGOS 1241]QRP47971.1 hypothetical protein I6J71_08810 [Amycolatopsis sp. FDAARGOS 1241]
MTPKPEAVPLDLGRFKDREQALILAGAGCPRTYTEIAKHHMTRLNGQLTANMLLFGSFVSRMRGLHEGVVREIAADDQHAAFPLIRAWLEVSTIALYCLRKPDYVNFMLWGPGKDRPGHKSFAAMFHVVREDAPGHEPIYRQLSDYSHFGQLGIWNAHTPGEDSRYVSWTDIPRFRNEGHFQTACAWAHELAANGFQTLHRLGGFLIPGLGDDSDPDDPATP